MRIIKSGMKETIHTCGKCGCVYAYTDRDVKVGTNFKTGEDFFYVACPECGRRLILERFRVDDCNFSYK